MSAVYANLSVMLGIFFQKDGECRQVRPCHNGRRPNVTGEGTKTGGYRPYRSGLASVCQVCICELRRARR